jgi:hypothetical protein
MGYEYLFWLRTARATTRQWLFVRVRAAGFLYGGRFGTRRLSAFPHLAVTESLLN